MTVTVRHGDLGTATTDITSIVRLPGGNAQAWSLIEAAEKGAPAMSGLAVEDPAATASLIGLKECHVEDTACADPTIFAGFWDIRNVARKAALRTGAQREWDATTTDLNTLLADHIIEIGGKRPAETDIARIDWLLGSGYLPLGDADFIDRATTTNLPAADYTGRTPADVLAECSNLSGQNYFVRWEQACTFADGASPWAAPIISSYVPPAGPYNWSSLDALGGKWGNWVGGNYSPAGSVYSCAAVGNTGGSPNNGSLFGIGLFAAMGVTAKVASYEFDLLAAGLPEIATVGLIKWNTGFSASGGYGITWAIVVEASHDGTAWSTVFDTNDISPGGGFFNTVGISSGTAGGTFIGTVPTIALAKSRYWRVTLAISWPWNDGHSAYFTIDGIELWSGSAIGPGPALGYHAYNWSGDASTCAISNVLSEIDNVTTFGPGGADKLTRNPGRVYSGCFFEYSGGHIYVPNATTAAAFRPRDIRSSDMNCTTAAAATALATAYLARCATEEDRITVNIEKVPAASVNLMRPGQRISVKLTQAPGYESGAYMAIMRRTVTANAYGFYNLQLELSNPVLTGFHPVASGLAPSLWSQNIGNIVAPAPADLTTALPGQRVALTFIRDGNGASALVTLGSAYIPGSVLVDVDGQPVAAASITETSPAAGTVTLDFIPAAAAGSVAAQAISASWQVA